MPQRNGIRTHMEDEWSRPDKPNKCTYQLGMSISYSPHHHEVKFENSKVLPNILGHIHNTPLVKLNRIPQLENVTCQIYAKCEFFNPGGSIKDRIALRMVEDAEKCGKLRPGYTIIEPTSGNTGLGLALVAAVKGYKCIIVLPEKMSKEKVDVMKALGAEIFRTPTGLPFDDPNSNIRVAERLVKEIPNSVVLNQHINPANPLAHYDQTAEEILDAFDGQLDMVVSASGTGGTITGLAMKIKERCPSCKVIGVDPIGSIVALPEELNETDKKFYEIEGIGYDFVPTVLNRRFVDKWYKSVDKPSFSMARKLIREEGLLCGGSSGAAMYCALKAAKDFNLGPDQKVVVVLPDSIRNYMTKFLSDDWLKVRSLYDGPDKDVSEQRWGSANISVLNLLKVTIFTPETTVRNAVEILKQNQQEFAVVCNDSKILATVNSNKLLECLIKGSPDAQLSCIMNTQFKFLYVSDTLAKLNVLLQTEPYVLILDDFQNVRSSRSILGYVRCTQLAAYLAYLDTC